MAEGRMPEVANLHVTVREWQDRIVFLHRIQPGRTDRSYGIHVAEIAGLAPAVVARARELLDSLEVHEGDAAARASAVPSAPAQPPPSQLSLFTEFLPHPVIDRLRQVRLDEMTPLEAFDTLRTLIGSLDPAAND